jgi:hypothetical protein
VALGLEWRARKEVKRAQWQADGGDVSFKTRKNNQDWWASAWGRLLGQKATTKMEAGLNWVLGRKTLLG